MIWGKKCSIQMTENIRWGIGVTFLTRRGVDEFFF